MTGQTGVTGSQCVHGITGATRTSGIVGSHVSSLIREPGGYWSNRYYSINQISRFSLLSPVSGDVLIYGGTN